MSLVDEIANILYIKTKNNPIFLHIDAIGFLNLGKHIGNSVNEILDNKMNLFNDALNKAEEMGANVLIPSFTYSITDSKIYDMKKSASQVGAATEYFRKKNLEKRTADPIFSYTVFSKNKILQDNIIKDYETFGETGLISKVFDMDGYIGSIGDVLWRTTEAHYLEKKLNVRYRFDKQFSGQVIDLNCDLHNVVSMFFCRDFKFKKATNFKPLINDMRDLGLVEKWNAGDFFIESVKIKDLFTVMKQKIEIDEFYFCRDDI